MSNWIIFSIGFLAQFFFGARLIIQWFKSERSKQVETPSIFWKLSLIASILMFMYGYLRQDLAIMLGQVFIYVVYIRNLQLQDQWTGSNRLMKFIYVGVPLIIAAYLIFISNLRLDYLISRDNIAPWLVGFGILGQIVFNARFFYQWIYSERQKESSLPMGFWVISLMGASLILAYGILRHDPVLIASHCFGAFVYFRNINLLKKSFAEA
ncbi:lauroyl acyltransferase [Antarcticibacterium flavum]|uniref:Lauroyl acyltransferase n=1 Tax=Antarcticibacterium flavum TaxID=2058175 RepID=A0A5B7X5E4_9FLAO|nr:MULTISPECIES: lipid-A-disaccharide synthase N-terminal domain-containing protein [Antarcticibacterium]MCM4159505.1 lauroyl acyltransferase [Antarcticibacterium sp. W02-3]QCY69863.1 lauroyl acyltransferase [Antarcticibacterium flavum]